MTSTAVTSEADAARDVSVFLCYRRSDGSWFAEWLYANLNGIEYRDKEGHRCRLVPYYDVTVPGVQDWKALHFPSLQTAKSLLVICTPGIAKDFSRRSQPDWVYEELRWWVGHRGSAPIVVDATGEGDRWLPDLVRRKWPDINRIPLDRGEAERSAEAGNSQYTLRIRERIVGAITELEQRTVFEDLERSQRQARRLTWALAATAVLLLIASMLGYYANERRKDALEQARIASERLTVMGGLMMRALDPEQGGSTSSTALLKLMNEILTRSNERQFVIVALDALSCWGSQSPSQAQTRAFERLFSKLSGADDAEVRSRLEMLRANLDADRRGSSRPHPCTLER